MKSVSLAEIEQSRVAPDVFVTRGIQESPTRRQCEVLESAGTTRKQVRHVERLKEVWSLRELGATPDVPSTGVTFGRVPDAVQRLKMKRVEGDADFLSGVRSKWNHANALTQLSLGFGRRFHCDSI